MKLRTWKGRVRLFLWQRRRPLVIALAVLMAATIASTVSPFVVAALPVGNTFLPWLLAGAVFVLALLVFLAD